jgi:GT2 family glycosyltransferase
MMSAAPQPAALPSVSIVVLNRHGRAYTQECLQSLAQLSYSRVSVILIDNGCEDFSPADVEQLLPGTAYLRTAVNLGFSGGVNLGIQHALAHGADYVFLLNNDTKVDANTVTDLVRVATDDTSIGIVGAKLLQLDAPGRLETVGLRVDLRWGRLYQIGFNEQDRGQYDSIADVAVVSGGAMLLSRSACEKVGAFDDRYFRYLEDVDLCLRARRAGFRVVLAPQARVHHKGKGMTGGHTSPLLLYYATRNHLMLMQEHAGGTPIHRLARAALVVGLNVAYAFRRDRTPRRARLAAVWRGARHYLRGLTGPAPEDRRVS